MNSKIVELPKKGWGVKKYAYWIGIDVGTKTGLAIWNVGLKRFEKIETVAIHEALEQLASWGKFYQGLFFVRVEDPRLARFWNKTDTFKLQGAGSVKRDASIWEDFLVAKDIPFELCRPNKALTKVPDPYFRKMTGWDKTTSEHGRDAAMLVFGK